MRKVGRSLPRIEDRPLVTGRGRFVADIAFPGQLAMRIVRSPVAFGRLRDVDVTAAFDVADAVAVWTAADVDGLSPVPVRFAGAAGLEPFRQPLLADALVRYVGEPVAAVFARSAGAADDAAERVALDVEPLEPVLTPHAGTAPAGDTRPGEAAVLTRSFGDLDAAFAAAWRVVECSLSLARDGAVPLETRGTVARWDAGREVLTIWGAARSALWNRDALAALLGLPRAGVEWRVPDVGGSFGGKGELSPEVILAALAARVFERPVRWMEDRRESLVAAPQARGMEASARAAVAADGSLLGLDVAFAVDQGAYVGPEGTLVAELVATMLPGPYRLEAFRATGRLRMTNRTPQGAARAAGRAEATFVRERLLDAVAAETGIDPLALRRRNLLGPEDLPPGGGMTALGAPFAHALTDAGRLVEEAARRLGLETLRRRAADRRAAGEPVGVGLALFHEANGAGAPERVSLAVDGGGFVEVVTGAAPAGQGLATLIAGIVADVLGVDMEAVRVTHGRSARIDVSGGTLMSSGSARVGTAALHAAEVVREHALVAAGALLGIEHGRLTIEGGRIRVADRHVGTALTLGEIARALEPGGALAGEDPCGLAADGLARVDAHAVSPGLAAAVVAIDPMTGIVRVPRALVAFEAGNAVHPAMVEGQLVGGAVQGLAGALFTRFDLAETGDPLPTCLADLLLPCARDVPVVEAIVGEESPNPANPLGLRGPGEAGATGIGAALAAAVDDALGLPGFARRLPIDPAAVLAALKARRGSGRAPPMRSDAPG